MAIATVATGTFANADAYRNLLHKKVSIRQAGKVVAYAEHIVMHDVEFRVRPAGVQRIRARHEREVIAYARGTVQATPTLQLPAGAVPVHFNPFVHDTFVLEDGTPVWHADALIMDSPCGSWVVNPR